MGHWVASEAVTRQGLSCCSAPTTRNTPSGVVTRPSGLAVRAACHAPGARRAAQGSRCQVTTAQCHSRSRRPAGYAVCLSPMSNRGLVALYNIGLFVQAFYVRKKCTHWPWPGQAVAADSAPCLPAGLAPDCPLKAA